MDAHYPRGSWPAGETIAKWCSGNGLTQYELAEAAGISGKHLSAVVTGRSLFSAETAVRLGIATGMSPRELFALQNDRLIELALEATTQHRPHSEG